MDTIAKIRQLIREDKVIPVVGAGVSFATARIPGWAGLIQDGLRYASEKRLDGDGQVEKGRELLSQGELTQAATLVKALLNAPDHPFADWLYDVLGKPSIQSTALIESIQNLCLPIIATTNYDDLLNDVGLNQNTQIYDWSEYQEMQQALLDHQKCILHLHGRYRKPQTTIFGADDYALLKDELGYKALLQQLWMNKHFLFIGCSKDGVLDDDLSTVLAFMGQWFPRLPHEHYILMKDDEIEAGTHIQLLKGHNIHAVGYGRTHDELPRFINHLNSNEDRLAEHWNRSKSRIETGLKNILDAKVTVPPQEVEQYLKNILGDPYYWIDSSRMAMLEDALRKYNQQIRTKKVQFENYQIIIKGLVSIAELEEKMQLWKENWNNPAALNNREFIDLGILAFYCLERFPREMLEDIRHRAPSAIHDYYFEHYLGTFVSEYKMMSGIKEINIHDHYQKDKYFFENLKRIIQSLRSVLALDADVLFPPVERATLTRQVPFPCLLFLSAESISIREIDPPYGIIAFLPGEKNFINRSAELVTYKDRKIVIGFNSQKCFSWDPERDIAASIFFEAPIQTAVYAVFHYHDHGTLFTEVHCGPRVYLFKDLILDKERKIAGNYSYFTRSAYHQRVFCCADITQNKVRDCIFEDKGDQGIVPLLSNEDLLHFIQDIPLIKEMIQNERSELRAKALPEDLLYPYLDMLAIKADQWQDKGVIIAKCRVSLWKAHTTVLMVFDPAESAWDPISIVVLPDKSCLAFGTIPQEDGGVGMVCGYLSSDGNLIEYIKDIDKKVVSIAIDVPGAYRRDYQQYGVQDMYNLTILSPGRILVNEEHHHLINVAIPSMQYERMQLDTDVLRVNYYP